MPASANIALPIIPRHILGSSDANPQERRLGEKSGQTFLSGTPIQVDVAGATGYVIACPAMTSVATAIIAGFAVEPAHNLGTSGQGSGPGGTAGGITYGSVQNQPNAKLITDAGPIIDGTIGMAVAVDTTLFVGVLGNGSDGTLAVTAITMLATLMGLTKDATNSYWYVDGNKTATNTGACVEIVGFVDPVGVGLNGVGTLNGRVLFRVTKAAQQLVV
jgi:hypothetical protein